MLYRNNNKEDRQLLILVHASNILYNNLNDIEINKLIRCSFKNQANESLSFYNGDP